MHNISTIYRFNTPFLNLEKEKGSFLAVLKKIEKSIQFDGIDFEKKSRKEGNYYKIVLEFKCNQENFKVESIQIKKKDQLYFPIYDDCSMGRIEFFYISDIENKIYHLPVFKLNIFLDKSFLADNTNKEKAVKFLNNIFECFDGLNEKEYLIDIDNNLYYKKGFFASKIKPSYDFSNLEKIKEDFESKDGMKLLKDFIVKFQNKNYILTRQNADEYHKLHGILLYFIYLVFLISQNLQKTENTLKNIDNIKVEGIYEGNLSLMKKRLSHIDNLNKDTFERYKRRLELFFNMF